MAYIENLIPGMPFCGKCPSCGGAMHFDYEVRNKLCRFCGPGSARYNERDVTRLTVMEKRAALPATAQAVTPQNGAGGHESHPPQLPPTSGPDAAMSQLNESSEATMDMLIAGEIPAPGPAGSKAMANPAVVMAHLQAKGFDKDACPYCTLRENGMAVDVEVVPHLPSCPNK